MTLTSQQPPHRNPLPHGKDAVHLRRRPLGGYRYVRLRWRVAFAVIDCVGGVLFAAAGKLRAWFSKRGLVTADPNVILLIQLDHLGDAIITTTMLPALRQRYPAASFEVLAGPWNRAVFEAAPEVDRVHVSQINRFARGHVTRFAWIAAMLWWGLRLRRRNIDLGIDVRGDFPLAIVLWLCGARRRLGWNCGGGRFLLTDSADYVLDRPEVDSRWALLDKLGIQPSAVTDRRPRFAISGEALRSISQRMERVAPTLFRNMRCHFFHSVGKVSGLRSNKRPPSGFLPWLRHPDTLAKESSQIAKPSAQECPGHPAQLAEGHVRNDSTAQPLVAMHVGAGSRAKQWPVEHWRELLGRLIVSCGAHVVLIGGDKDRAIAQKILGERPWPGVVDWTGSLSIAESAALLERADVLVGADSGPAHLAAAVDAPVVVLFSGTNNQQQWQPYGRQVTVVRRPVECSPCHRQRCPLPTHPCMRELQPARVAAAVLDLLRTPSHGPRRKEFV